MPQLTYSELVKFDLLDKVEAEMSKNLDFFMDFYKTKQQINSTDQFIRELPSFPGSTDKILRSELISAIGSTLAIEGIKLNKDEIEKSFKKAAKHQKLIQAEQEAENSRQAYDFVIEYISNNEKNEYVEGTIRQIHKTLTDKIGYQSNDPGEYRNSSVTFGNHRKEGLCQKESQVRDSMRLYVDWLNSDCQGHVTSDSIVKAIAAHYYLTEIHPFGDGNGRTARTLEAMVLYKAGVNKYCFWSLANFWSANREEYISKLGIVAATSNLLDFILWGLKGYLGEIQRIKNNVKFKIQQLMITDYARYKCRTLKVYNSKTNRCIACLSILVRRFSDGIPLVDFRKIPEVEAIYSDLTSQTQRRDLEFLLTNGFIKIGKQNNVFILSPSYEILETVNYYV